MDECMGDGVGLEVSSILMMMMVIDSFLVRVGVLVRIGIVSIVMMVGSSVMMVVVVEGFSCEMV